MAVSEPDVPPECREPSVAPHPVTVHRVDDSSDEDGEDAERRKLPPLRCRAGGNRRGGVHEHHLEEEVREDGSVVGDSREEEALHAEQPPIVAAQMNAELAVEP